MILKEFSTYIQSRKEEITQNKTTAVKILCDWIRFVITKNPKNHVDKIVHTEIMFAQNEIGDYFIVGKSESGRKLVNALYNFALSYEHYIMQQWINNTKPEDFK